MTDDEKLMQQALEALELAYAGIDAITVHGKAIAALRERLAQPEQEPVAWADMDVRGENKGLSWTPGHFHTTPLYTTPPQRKPLTDEVIWLEYQRFWPFHPAEEPKLAKDIVKFARAIESKIKEKNT